MKSYSLADIAKVIGSNLDKLRYNNKLIEAQRKIVNPSFLEILEELSKDDEVLAASLMNWYMNKYGKSIGEKDLSSLILEQLREKTSSFSSSSSCGYSCGWEPESDRC